MGIRAVVSSLVLLTLVACGGSSSSSSAEGIWVGTYTNDPTTGPIPLHGLIQDGGLAIFYDDTGLSSVVSNFSGTDFSGSGKVYPPTGFIFTGNNPTLDITARITVSNSTMSGALTLQGAAAPLNLKPFTQFTGTPSIVEGTWSGAYFGSQNVALTVLADGSIDGSDAFGCHLSGSIKLIDASEDLFSLSVTGSGASFCLHQYKGLAFESTDDQLGIAGHAAGTYYYLAAYDSTGAFLAEVKVQ